MGYSISVKVRHPKLLTQMLSFMETHYRPWWQVFNETPRSVFAELTDDVSYGDTKNTLGFDYSCISGWEREHVYATVRWMALKVGKRKSKFEKLIVKPSGYSDYIFEAPEHYYFYDNIETPVLATSSEEEAKTLPGVLEGLATDNLGCPWPSSTGLLYAAMMASFDKDPAVGERYSEATKVLDSIGDPGVRLKKHRKIQAELAGDEVMRGRAIIRGDLERLDALWKAT